MTPRGLRWCFHLTFSTRAQAISCVSAISVQCILCICALSVFELSLKVGNLEKFAANKSMNLPTRVTRAKVIKMQTVAAMLKVNRQTQNRWEEP